MTEQAGTAKAWGGRFAQAPDRRLEAFNASVAFDVRLVREDIRGSIAHARMLGKQGIIGVEDAATLEHGLWQVLSEVEAGDFSLTVADEDVHTGVERRLREIVGAVAGKLHTGRSRNDQVATDLRLWTKGALSTSIERRARPGRRLDARRRSQSRPHDAGLHPPATRPAGAPGTSSACLRRHVAPRPRSPGRRLPPYRRDAAWARAPLPG